MREPSQAALFGHVDDRFTEVLVFYEAVVVVAAKIINPDRGFAAVTDKAAPGLCQDQGLLVENEAIEKAEAIVPDIVLMDLNMPHCSGLEATQALQTKMPQVDILVLTVRDPVDYERALLYVQLQFVHQIIDALERLQAFNRWVA